MFGDRVGPALGRHRHRPLGGADREKGRKQPGTDVRAGETRAECRSMSADGDDDKTGYGNPPKHARWKDGESGNPKRRYPKRVETTIELIDKLLLKQVDITVGEK